MVFILLFVDSFCLCLRIRPSLNIFLLMFPGCIWSFHFSKLEEVLSQIFIHPFSNFMLDQTVFWNKCNINSLSKEVTLICTLKGNTASSFWTLYEHDHSNGGINVFRTKSDSKLSQFRTTCYLLEHALFCKDSYWV